MNSNDTTATPATNGRELTKTPGYHVFGRNADLSTFPTAVDFDISDDGLLTILGAGLEILAVFNRAYWASVERIAA